MKKFSKSKKLFAEAQKHLVGGVNSPVRTFKAVGGEPLFITKAKGSNIYDADGNKYIDYVCSWGPMILGHGHPRVIKAIERSLKRGTSYGAPTELEIELAMIIKKAFPSIEKVRMTSSGTEAGMSAIRLARGHTGRDKIIKFEGCYHGHSDSLLVKAGSGATTLGVPDSLGVPLDFARNTITVPYNNINAVQDVVKRHPKEIACVIVEPIAGNMGVVPPEVGFLEGLRRITQEDSIVLIFDEVITGFRVAFGGAQEFYGLKADLTCLGKIIGGGLPVGAFGGRKDIMDKLAPEGPVYQAGTLSGNPIAMSAGIETLKILSDSNIYERLDEKSEHLCCEIKKLATSKSIPITINRIGSMFTLFFTDNLIKNYQTAKTSNVSEFAKFFKEMQKNGIYLPPSQFEACFLSVAHSNNDIKKTIEACKKAFNKM